MTSRPPGNPRPGPTAAPDVPARSATGRRARRKRTSEPAPERTAATTWGTSSSSSLRCSACCSSGSPRTRRSRSGTGSRSRRRGADGGAMTTAAVRDWVRRSASRALGSRAGPPGSATGDCGRGCSRRCWSPSCVAVAVPWLVDARCAGCPTVSSAARRPSSCGCSPSRRRSRPRGSSPVGYERWTADGNHGCPTAQAYVFAAEPATIAHKVATTDGGRTPRDSLRAVGPRPDMWLASTPPRGRRGEAQRSAGGAVAESLPGRALAAWCSRCRPVRCDRPAPGPQVFRQLDDRSALRCVRPDPTHRPGRAARHGAALRPATHRLPRRRAIAPSAVERSLDAARGRRPARSAAPPPPALPPARAAAARTRGAGYRRRRHRAGRRTLQPGRGARRDVRSGPGPPGADQRIEAVYPVDTADQDLQLVRLRWTDPVPVQERAAEAFGRWLRSDAGRSAVVAHRAAPDRRPSRLPRRRSPATTASTPRWPRPRNRSPSSSGRTPTPRTRRPSCPAGCSSSSTRPARWAGWSRAAPRRHRAAPVPPWWPTPWAPDWRACSRATSSGSGSSRAARRTRTPRPCRWGSATRGSPPRGTRSPACSRAAARRCSAR